MSESRKGQQHVARIEVVCQYCGKIMKGTPSEVGWKKYCDPLCSQLGSRGRKRNSHYSEKTRKKLSKLARKRTGKKNPFYGKQHSDEAMDKMAEGMKNRDGMSGYEKRIDWLIKKRNLPFKFTGFGHAKDRIGGKKPDFSGVGIKKSLIEVFCSRDKRKNRFYKLSRFIFFGRYGYNVLFLDENDIFTDDWVERCYQRIQKFVDSENNRIDLVANFLRYCFWCPSLSLAKDIFAFLGRLHRGNK